MKTGIICLAFSIAMLVLVSAATPREMYENGVVSDDGIRLGDARDGEVSDVSEGGEIFSGEGTGMLGDMINGTDASTKDNTTAVPDMTNAPETSNATSSADGTNGNMTDGEGVGVGVVIAVIVVIAIVVIIFLLLPKRK